MEFINHQTDNRFLDEEDHQLFAQVVGTPLSELKTELIKRPPAFIQQVYSNEKFIESDLNVLGLHVYRSLLSSRIHDGRNCTTAQESSIQEQYKKAGYVKINSFLDSSAFKDLRRTFERAASPTGPEKILFNDRGFFARQRNIIGLIKDCCHITSLSDDARQGIPRSQFWNLRHCGIDPQYRFHTDTFHPVCKMWIYLDDIGLDDGPLTLVAGSHLATERRLRWDYETSLMTRGSALWATRVQVNSKPGAFRVAEGATEEEELQELKRIGYNDIVRLTGAANTLVIANTHGFHKRGEAAPGTIRQQLTVQYRSKAFGVY